MKIRPVVIVAMALAIALRSHAVDAAEPSVELGSILVTATRYPVPRDQALPASIIIEREELQRSLAPDVLDVLRFYSGIEFGRYGGPGQSASVFMRGTDSNHALVLVDGVRINPGTVGGAALQNIAPELVQRIEVVKGPRSTLYGSDAIGGVIQIFTQAQNANGFSSAAQYGANDTISGSSTAGWSGEAAHLGFGVNYLQTDGFAPRTIDRRGGAHDNLSLNLAGSLDLAKGKLSANYWRAAGATDYIGFSSRTFGNALITQEQTNDAAAVSYAWVQGAWSSKVEINRMTDDIEQGTVHDVQGRFESSDFAATRRNSIGWQNDIDLGRTNRFSFGAMYHDETADTATFGEVSTDVINVYVQDRIVLDRHAIVLAAGYVENETFGGHATWNAEYGLHVTPATRLIASAGTAFRAPDATDLYGFGGNPDLEPERSLNYELGLRHGIGERQQVFANVFENRIDDLIEYIVTDPATFDGELRNAQLARIRGIEAGYEINTEKWQLRTEAIYQEPENRTTGEPLLRRAETNVTVSYVQRIRDFELGLDILAAGKRQDFGGITLDSYLLTNLTARYHFGAGWSAQARIENLLDEEYELASDYNTPGRGVFVALRYAAR